MTSTPRTDGDSRLAAAPVGTAIASAVVAVLAVLLTFSQPVSAAPSSSIVRPAAVALPDHR